MCLNPAWHISNRGICSIEEISSHGGTSIQPHLLALGNWSVYPSVSNNTGNPNLVFSNHFKTYIEPCISLRGRDSISKKNWASELLEETCLGGANSKGQRSFIYVVYICIILLNDHAMYLFWNQWGKTYRFNISITRVRAALVMTTFSLSPCWFTTSSRQWLSQLKMHLPFQAFAISPTSPVFGLVTSRLFQKQDVEWRL